MIIPLFRLYRAKREHSAMVDALMAKGAVRGDFLNILEGDFYEIAKANGMEFMDAKALATGRSKVAIGARMAAGFATTMARTAVAHMQGKPTMCTPAQEATRIGICAGNKEAGVPACQFYIPADNRCSECGCPRASRLASKWKVAAAKCPKGKWPVLNGG